MFSSQFIIYDNQKQINIKRNIDLSMEEIEKEKKITEAWSIINQTRSRSPLYKIEILCKNENLNIKLHLVLTSHRNEFTISSEEKLSGDLVDLANRYCKDINNPKLLDVDNAISVCFSLTHGNYDTKFVSYLNKIIRYLSNQLFLLTPSNPNTQKSAITTDLEDTILFKELQSLLRLPSAFMPPITSLQQMCLRFFERHPEQKIKTHLSETIQQDIKRLGITISK